MKVFFFLALIVTGVSSCTKDNRINDADRKYCWTCIDALGNSLFEKCNLTLEEMKNSGTLNGYPAPVPDSAIYRFCTRR